MEKRPKLVTFFSLKGGQGKTTLATQYALFRGYNYITNDVASGTESFYAEKFAKGKFNITLPNDNSMDVDLNNPNVLDLGGFVDERTPEFLKNSTVVVIPTKINRYDLLGFFNTIKVVQKYNKRIVIAINNTDTRTALDGYNQLLKIYDKKYDIVTIRESAFIERFMWSGTPIFDMEEKGAVKQAIDSLKTQLIDLFGAIERNFYEARK
jgi:cellulose biosynthesis protein BcsQ